MKKNDKKLKSVGKMPILLGWILLIIFVSAALGLTYLKFFGPNENLSEHLVEEEVVSPIITEALQSIVDNFNNSDLNSQYKDINIDMNATLNGTSIIVEYSSGTNVEYEFTFDSPNLSVSLDDSNVDIFNVVYTIMIYANQQRLGNNSDIDDYIVGFLDGDLDVDGLSKEVSDNTSLYSIDISKVIGGDTDNQGTGESDDSSVINDNDNVGGA